MTNLELINLLETFDDTAQVVFADINFGGPADDGAVEAANISFENDIVLIRPNYQIPLGYEPSVD